jgi:hypothetical protein
MILKHGTSVNRNTLPGAWRRFGTVIAILIVILTFLMAHSISAGESRPDGAVGGYTKDGAIHWVVPGGDVDVTKGKFTPGELEALFPMSTERENAIVHEIPKCPVIIDGITYPPEDISLFNGKRLRFIMGKDGMLYAFTTAGGLEEFQSNYDAESVMEADSLLAEDNESVFYKDWWYGGERFWLIPDTGFPVLSQLGFDNALSSVEVNAAVSWAYLYDDTWYIQGITLPCPQGAITTCFLSRDGTTGLHRHA